MLTHKTKAGTVFQYEGFADPDEPKTVWHFRKCYLTRQEQYAEHMRMLNENPDGLKPDEVAEERRKIGVEFILDHFEKAEHLVEPDEPVTEKSIVASVLEDYADRDDVAELVNAICYGPAKMKRLFEEIQQATREARERKNG